MVDILEINEEDAKTIISVLDCTHGLLGALSTTRISLLRKIHNGFPHLEIDGDMFSKYIDPATEVKKFDLHV